MTSGSDQPLPPTPPPPAFTYPPIIIVLSLLILVVFFFAFFSIYFCRCFLHNLLCLRGSATAAPAAGAATTAAVGNGLDPSIVQSFPSFAYSTVKDYRAEKFGLECAICLLEFKDTDLLRLLPTCCHVFHQECIDLWLESHNTCPVCRRNLTSPEATSPAAAEAAAPPVDEDHHHVSFSITVDNQDVRLSDLTLDKYPRSHSTGHSIQNPENKSGEDRFTLRIPHHVRSRIFRGHTSSKSWSVEDSVHRSVVQVFGDDNIV